MVTVTPHTKKDKQTMRNVYLGATNGVKKGIRNSLFEIGRENTRHLQSLFRDEKKTGRIYFIKGRLHQASAPGEAPAILSGNLFRSVDFNVRGSSEMTFGEKMFYGEFLEHYMNRPHVKRTADERGTQNRTILEDTTHKDIHKRASKGL